MTPVDRGKSRVAEHDADVQVWTEYLPGGEVTVAHAVCGCGWESERGDESDVRDAAHMHVVNGSSADRTAERDYSTPPDPFLLRGADRLYDECERAIHEGRLDARSPIGDATLDYRDLRWPE